MGLCTILPPVRVAWICNFSTHNLTEEEIPTLVRIEQALHKGQSALDKGNNVLTRDFVR
jgi:hypothetical protein